MRIGGHLYSGVDTESFSGVRIWVFGRDRLRNVGLVIESRVRERGLFWRRVEGPADRTRNSREFVGNLQADFRDPGRRDVIEVTVLNRADGVDDSERAAIETILLEGVERRFRDLEGGRPSSLAGPGR